MRRGTKDITLFKMKHLYLYRSVCVCVHACVSVYVRACVVHACVRACVSVCVSFQAGSRLWSERGQIWHTHADSSRKGSGPNRN